MTAAEDPQLTAKIERAKQGGKSDCPVLRIRGERPDLVTELTLDGVDLLPFIVTSLTLDLDARARPLATAVITLNVTPDVELPATVQVIDNSAAEQPLPDPDRAANWPD